MSNTPRKYPLPRRPRPSPSNRSTSSEPSPTSLAPTPFELTDCDRVRLAAAGARRARTRLSEWDRTQAAFVDRMIAAFGYVIKAIGTGECSHPGCDGGLATDPYSYTVGRSFFGVAELVTTGLGSAEAVHVSNSVGQLVPWEWEPGIELEVDGERFRLDAVHPTWLACDRSRLASWYRHFACFHQPSNQAPEVWQIVWADRAGRLPDEDGCDPIVVDQQPLLANDPISYPPIDFDYHWQDLTDSS